MKTCRLLAKHFCRGSCSVRPQKQTCGFVTHLPQLWLLQLSQGGQPGWAQGQSPPFSFPNGSVRVCASGPVCPGPGALQVQRGEHDGLSAAQHREPARLVRGGQVVHGEAAGAPQARDRAPRWHDDSKWAAPGWHRDNSPSWCQKWKCCLASPIQGVHSAPGNTTENPTSSAAFLTCRDSQHSCGKGFLNG